MSTSRSLSGDTQRAGFTRLLNECLSVTRTDELLVIFDESFAPFADAFIAVIEESSISTTFVSVPMSYQRKLILNSSGGAVRENIALPVGLVAAISSSTAVLNLLNGDPEAAALRRTINHSHRTQVCRLATIPGLTADVIESIIKSPIDSIVSDCELMAWALGEASIGRLTSYDGAGRRYDLHFQLEGWDIEPIMSPGVLLAGSWGNVPPGETFCCPKPETVHGEISINGSIPKQVFEPGESIVLRFDAGRLTSWRSATPAYSERVAAALSFFESTKSRAELHGDPNWNSFAELGIGLNPEITRLTGNSLFDEKAKGSIHIAIGDNSAFGDDIVSFIHADLVTWRPDLCLDQHTIIRRGTLLDGDIRRRRSVRLSCEPLPLDVSIQLRIPRVEYVDGVVKRRLSKARRVNHVVIGDDEIGRRLAILCPLLQSYGSVNVGRFLDQVPAIDGMPSMDLLAFLYHYRMLHTVSAGE